MSSQVIYMGTVTSVCDEYNGGRIRVRIPLDGSKEPNTGWPYAFPLLPKIMQITPKVGEMVLIFIANTENRESSRFYIGPIISQPQKMYNDQKGLLDNPLCLLPNSHTQPLETTTHFPATFGSFAKINDISLSGRKGEDIILRDDEINIRCGVRKEADGLDNKSEVGNILFNSSNPAYIQLKYKREDGDSGNLINLVGGRINLMSHSAASAITNSMKNYNNTDVSRKEAVKKFFSQTSEDITKAAEELKTLKQEENIYDQPEFKKIMAELHQLPYGDKLVKVLETMRSAIQEHTHPWAQLPPTAALPCMLKLNTWGEHSDPSQSADLSEILLSDTVRIS